MSDGTPSTSNLDTNEGATIAVPDDWDEGGYLAANPDVEAAVEAGECATGYHHYMIHGILEGRLPAWKSKKKMPWPWSDTLYLAANPGLKEDLAAIQMTPHEHFVKYGALEARPTGLEPIREKCINGNSLPSWAVDEMFELSYFEPGIDPEAYGDATIFNPFSRAHWGEALARAGAHLRHRSYDFVFFLPWIKRGGADLASLYHIKSAARHFGRVAVFLTEDCESEWVHRLPDAVDLVPLGSVFRGIPLPEQVSLVYHLIAALAPKKVHIINSHVAWTLLDRNAHALANLSTIYVSLYCYDYDQQGEPVGYARNVQRCAEAITGIFTDNSNFRRHLSEDLGVSASKIHVLAHPVDWQPAGTPSSMHSNRILWASRLDRQKQPRILIEIANSLPQLQFHVFGSAVMEDGSNIVAELQKCPNISYHGPFDGPQDILNEHYRCFLYTSRWDGLPNIVLEMMQAAMLVVAPALGGIADDLGCSKCVLVDDSISAASYIEALRWIYQFPEKADAIRRAGHQYVREHHTWDAFDKSLDAAGYFSGDIAVSGATMATKPLDIHLRQKLNAG